MSGKNGIQSNHRLSAYCTAAGLGAFAMGQGAQAAVTLVPAVQNLFQNTGNQRTNIDWNNDGTIDHFINNGDGGVQVSPFCDLVADPSCKGFDAGVTSVTFSAQTAIDTNNAGNPLNPDPATWPFNTTWVNNAYYAVGFEDGVVIDGSHKKVGIINQDLYSGFLTFQGSGGVGPHDGFTHVAPGKFVGFGFEAVDGTHYGWVQIGLQTGPGGFLTSRILTAAYESTPNLGIRTPIAGDLNKDGLVDILDLGSVLSNWNTAVTEGDGSQGDSAGRIITTAESTHAVGQMGGDGFIDIVDLNSILANWNQIAAPPGTMIPEPASLLILAAGAGAVGLRRKRAVDLSD